MNAIDTCINYLSPSWAKKRIVDRVKIDNIREYQAAKKTRFNADWSVIERSEKHDILTRLSAIRARSLDLVKNDPYAKRAISVVLEATIGSSIKVDFENDNAKKLWDIFSSTKKVDFYGERTLHDLWYLAWKTTLEAGDCIVLKRYCLPTPDYPFGFKIQILPPRYLPLSNTKDLGDRRIFSSIEYNHEGIIQAYHILKNDPMGSWATPEYSAFSPDDVSLVMIQESLGGDRGYPYLTNSLLTLRNLAEYEMAEMLKQKYHACITAFIQSPPDLDEQYFSTGKKLEDEVVEMGVMKRLRPGENIIPVNPPSLANFPEHIRQALLKVAAGLNIPYPLLSEDYSTMNYSSFRGNLIKFENTLTVIKNNSLIPKLCRPVVDWFLKDVENFHGRIKNKTVSFVTPKLKYLDPSKEIPASILAIKSGLTSYGNEIKANGGNPDEIIADIKKWNDKMDALGLTLTSDARVDMKIKCHTGGKKDAV